MNIVDVKFYTENGMLENDEIVNWNMSNGKLTVSYDSVSLRKICFETDIYFLPEDVILGDAFERGYGDLKWEKVCDKTIPWYFFVRRKNVTVGIGVKTLPNALCWWKIKNRHLYFIADIGSGGLGLNLNGNTLEICRFVEKTYDCSSFEAVCDFCGQLCDNPRLLKNTVYGGNDWYCNYGNNTYEKIINHTKQIAECAEGLKNRPYMVIDDGWQICYDASSSFNGGPWIAPNKKFRDMKKLANEIKSYDVIPGIWFRPLFTTEYFQEKTLLKQSNMKKVLDPSVPETLEKIKEDITVIKEWGYRLIKHDFSTFDILGKWGFDIDENVTDGLIFYDKKRTTAQIIKDMYKTIREAAGDDVAIIGCNTIGHLSAGYFEIQRTGDDTSGIDFERTKKMGVNTLAFRIPQHNKFYLSDADCVGITKKIPWEKNKQWLDLVAKSGTPLFVSIEEGVLTDEIKNDISKAFKYASENTVIAQPVDWEEKEIPEKWVTAYGKAEYKF